MLQSDSKFDGWAMKPLGYSHIVQPELGKDIWAGIFDIDKIAGNKHFDWQGKAR